MTLPWYATREDVKRALDVKETARNNGQIDRALQAASSSIEGLCHRRFYPEVSTRYFDWPGGQYARPWRLWLEANELISVTSLVTGADTIAASDYFLRRSDRREEPPYTHIELNLNSSAAFGGSTYQRDIAITGLFGYRNDESPAGGVDEATTVSETDLDVTISAAIGVGQALRIGTERLIVTGKTMRDTGVNIDAADSLTASMADVSITLSTTIGAPVVDEVILIDSERMLIVDVAGTVATVKRAWDGSVLATHAAGADIYAPRTLTVTRGALGTTAATMSAGDDIFRWDPPGPVRQLCIAEALSELLQERTGWARTTTSSSGSAKAATLDALNDLREQVYTSHGRKARKRAI